MNILINYVKISNETINEITSQGTSGKIDQRAKDVFYLLFKNTNFSELITEKSAEKIELANLKYDTNIQLLAKLDEYATKRADFLDQNYDQLKYIIETNYDLRDRAINTLKSARNKSKISDDLIESLAILFESTSSREIKNTVLSIFKEIQMIKKDSAPAKMSIILADQINSSDESKLNKVLGNYLSNFNQIRNDSTQLKNMSYFLENHIQANLNSFFDNQIVVSLIEQMLGSNKSDFNFGLFLNYYLRIIHKRSIRIWIF